jgi:hypothetical protein
MEIIYQKNTFFLVHINYPQHMQEEAFIYLFYIFIYLFICAYFICLCLLTIVKLMFSTNSYNSIIRFIYLFIYFFWVDSLANLSLHTS